MSRFLSLGTIVLLSLIVVLPVFASADPELANVETFRADGPATFQVGGREIVVTPGDSGILVYNDVDAGYPVLCEGMIADDVGFQMGDVPVVVPAGSIVGFYRSGALKRSTAIAETTVFPVAGTAVTVAAEYDIYTPLSFHENGDLEYGHLTENILLDVRGQYMECGGEIRFDDAGAVEYCFLPSGGTVVYGASEIDLKPSSALSFFPGGAIKSFVPRDETELWILGQEIVVKPELTVSLHPNGNVQGCIFAERPVVHIQGKPVELESGYQTAFYENGHLSVGVLASDTAFVVGEQEFVFASSGGRPIVFHPDGSFKAGFPAESAEVDFLGNTTTIGPDTYVEFDETGTLIVVQPQG